MRLSERNGRIVAQTALHADETITELARRSKCQAHTVRYALTEMVAQGVITKRWVVNLMACGWSRYEIFFAVASGARRARQRAIEWLVKHELCTYLAEVGGEFDYELILLARTTREVQGVLAELSERCGDLCFSKAVAQHSRVSYFPRKYLSSTAAPREALVLESSERVEGIDSIEHAILVALSTRPDTSQRELARQLQCTPLTISRRIDRLRSAGVLRGAMFSLNSSRIGAQNYILLIYARGFRPDVSARLYDFCLRHPNCTNMKDCFGSWDFEVGIEVLEHATLLRVKEELLENFSGDVQSITVLSRFATLKYSLYPFRSSRRLAPPL